MIPTPDQNKTDLTKCLRILLGKQDIVEVCYLRTYFEPVRSFLFKEMVNTLTADWLAQLVEYRTTMQEVGV